MTATALDIRNRITRSGMADPHALLDNPMNFRIHTAEQRQAMETLLDEVGWVQDVIVNERNDRLVDGHLRCEIARDRNEQVPVKWVDLTEKEERTVLRTFDPISALAQHNRAKADELAALAKPSERMQSIIDAMNKARADMIDSLNDEESNGKDGDDDDGLYSRLVESPVYTPQGPCPSVDDLADTTRADALIEQINASAIPRNVQRFLLLAAHRHVEFDYQAIAEYYAHADETVQDLIEQSALVIIDFQRAIDLGFVELSKALQELEAEIDD